MSEHAAMARIKIVAWSVGALAILLGGLCPGRAAWAGTVYVRASGEDTNDGLSAATAVRTITHGAALAQAGDRVLVGPGTYAEGNISPVAFARVTFVADRRGVEVGDPPGDAVIDATTFDTGFELNHNLAVTIDGFVIYGAGIGIYVKSWSDQAVVRNNIVSNNLDNGIYIQDSQNVTVFNNLVYNNGDSGILITGNVSGSAGARIINNTVYGNTNRGIFFAGTDISSPNGLAINNIVQANLVAGMEVNESSRSGYQSAGNVSPDHYASGTPVDATDIRADALFINPPGADQMLGGADSADDDFHLSQKAAGQATTSPAVDAGSDSARLLRLDQASTRTDGRPDRGIVDAGYHYGNFSTSQLHPQLQHYALLYVDPVNGSDTNDGSSASSAMQSLPRALDLAQPGNRIVMLGGTYDGGDLTFAHSGTSGREIILQGMNGAAIDATGSQRGFLLVGLSSITLDGLDISGASESGIEIRNGFSGQTSGNGPSNITIRRCHLHNNGRRGLYVNGASAVSMQSTVADQNGSRGVQVETGQLNIQGSTINANTDSGLWAISSSTSGGSTQIGVSGTRVCNNQGPGVIADGPTVVTLSDVTLCGNRQEGLRQNGGSAQIVRATVTQNQSKGLAINGADQVVVQDATIEGNGGNGIEIISANSAAVSGTVAHANHGDGLWVSKVTNATVSTSQFLNNAACGIVADQSGLTVSLGTISGNGQEGLRQSGGTAQLTTVAVTQNHSKGLAVVNAGQFSLELGEVTNNGGNGVQLISTNGPSVLRGVVVSANQGNGLWLVRSSPVTLSDAQFVDNTKTGVLAEHSAVSIAHSAISGSPEGGARFTRNSSGTLTAVTVVNNGDVGIQGISSPVTVSGGDVENNAGVGIEYVPTAGTQDIGQLAVASTRVCNNQGQGLYAQNATVTLSDVTVCGNTKDGLEHKGGGSAQIVRATVTQNQNKGLSIENVSQVAVQDSTIESNGDNGVQVLTATAASVSGTVAKSNNNDGLWLSGVGTATVSASQFVNNAANGIVADQTGLALSNVSLNGNTQDGLNQNGGAVQLMGLTVTQNQNKGVSVINASMFDLETGTISNNGDNGVQITSTGASSLSGATVSSNSGNGLWLVDTAPVIISNSQFTGSAKSGVLAEHSAVTVSNATISGNHGGGARFVRQSSGTLTGVTAVNNGGHGIQGMSSPVTVSGGDVENNAGAGIESVPTAGTQDIGQLVVTGVRVCNNQAGGLIAQNAAVTLSDATVCGNAKDGVRQHGGSVQLTGLTVTQNQNKGVTVDSASQVVVQDTKVGSNGDNGVQVLTSTGFSISGSVLYSNAGDGLTILDCAAPSVQNNLIYTNTSNGIQIRGTTSGSPNAQVLNNTVYANGDRGLVIGGSNAEPASAGAVVLRNIFQQNGTAGLQINQLSLPGYTGDYNLNLDPYGPLTPIGPNDVLSDALFVRPAGDDFHLSQASAGQSVISPAVDAGGIDVAAAGLAGTSTRTDGVADTGVVDLGYHYQP